MTPNSPVQRETKQLHVSLVPRPCMFVACSTKNLCEFRTASYECMEGLGTRLATCMWIGNI